MPAVNAQGGVRDAQSRPCQETSRVSGSRHWKAQCHESGTLRLGRGRRKRAGDSTSPAAYSTWGGADGKGLQPVAPRRRPTLLERGGGDGNTASLPDTVRRYKAPRTRTGYKLLITPSDASVKRVRTRLRAEWEALVGHPIDVIVKRLNPIIRGWATYFRIGVATKTFSRLDHWMVTRELRYVQRRHPRKSHAWHKARYGGKLHPQKGDTWVFGNTQTGAYLLLFRWFKIERHILTRLRLRPTSYMRRENLTQSQHVRPY